MDLKIRWPKFIPLFGIIFVIVDTSHDGEHNERLYIWYQSCWLAITLLLMDKYLIT